jgi:DNA-binding XRE family transcriptional regulator
VGGIRCTEVRGRGDSLSGGYTRGRALVGFDHAGGGAEDRPGPAARGTNGDHEAPFGTELERLRDAAGLTQEELASRARLTAKAVSALERGVRRRPYPHTVRSLADALELTDA